MIGIGLNLWSALRGGGGGDDGEPEENALFIDDEAVEIDGEQVEID